MPPKFIYAYFDDQDNAPVTGWALYLVMDGDASARKNLRLFHIATLTSFVAREVKQYGMSHPSTASALRQIQENVQTFNELGAKYSGQTVRQVVSMLTGKPLEDTPALKAPTEQQVLRSGAAAPVGTPARGPGVIGHILERLASGWVSPEDILASLATTFPERDTEGMAKTVAAQLRRIPKERGVPVYKNGNLYTTVKQ